MPLSEKQIEARTKGVGCSELSALIGMNPYRGEFDVYARLMLPDTTITVEDPDGIDDDPREWGNILEAPIAERYAQRERVKVRTCAPDETFRHASAPVIGNPDRLVEGCRKGLEVKTSDIRMAHRWGASGTEDFPDEHHIQCMGYMAVTGFEEWDLAALIGGNRYRVYRMERDVEAETEVIDAVSSWWDRHILTAEAPPISSSPAATAWLKRIYPRNRAPLMEPNDDLVRLAREYDHWRAAAKKAEGEKDRFASQLKEAIGEAEGFALGGKKPSIKVTWRNNKDGERTDWPALATKLGATPADIREFTRPTVGARVLHVTGSEFKTDGE